MINRGNRFDHCKVSHFRHKSVLSAYKPILLIVMLIYLYLSPYDILNQYYSHFILSLWIIRMTHKCPLLSFQTFYMYLIPIIIWINLVLCISYTIQYDSHTHISMITLYFVWVILYYIYMYMHNNIIFNTYLYSYHCNILT